MDLPGRLEQGHIWDGGSGPRETGGVEQLLTPLGLITSLVTYLLQVEEVVKVLPAPAVGGGQGSNRPPADQGGR
jgi:hypothetical protein